MSGLTMFQLRRIAAALAASLLMASALGCRANETREQRHEDRALAGDTMQRYADIACEGYTDAVDAARRLGHAIDAFVEQPSAAGLEAARAAWLDARIPYLQTEVFRYYDGPIDRVEGFINTWPIDENYVESGASAATPGIIDDTASYPEITASLLASLNEKEGETNVSTGFHVIEFLLWGRDTNPHGPGNRSHLDYVVPRTGKRRGVYLKVVSELLIRHLEEVALAWAPGRGDNYRAKFLALPRKEALGLVIKGMGTLSGPELSGERLTVAYETKDQTNEHSCFSDNTHNDIAYDALGIQNTCLGRHQRPDGTTTTGAGLCDLLATRDQAVGTRLEHDLEASVNAARSIPPPFDQAILGDDSAPGRLAVRRTIQALEAQATTFARAAATLDIGLSMSATVKRR